MALEMCKGRQPIPAQNRTRTERQITMQELGSGITSHDRGPQTMPSHLRLADNPKED